MVVEVVVKAEVGEICVTRCCLWTAASLALREDRYAEVREEIISVKMRGNKMQFMHRSREGRRGGGLKP